MYTRLKEFFFQSIGILRVLNQVTKTSGRDYMAPYTESLNSVTMRIKERGDLMGNTVVRQLMTKFICRRVLSCLPQRTRRTRVKGIAVFPRA
jgi:hypothetical protein